MSYMKSKDLGKLSKKFLSAISSKNSEKRNLIIKQIIENPYFSFQKREILDYILLSYEGGENKKTFEKALDIILLTSQKDGRINKNLLIEIMKRKKDFSSSISSYFLDENKRLLNTSDKENILLSFENKKISLKEKDQLISSAEKRNPKSSENINDDDFIENQLENRNIASAIRNSNSIVHSNRIIIKAYDDRQAFAKKRELSGKTVSFHEIFDYDTQYLSYVALNDSKADSEAMVILFKKFMQTIEYYPIFNNKDEKSAISTAHIFNDSPKTSEDKIIYSNFIGDIARLKLENSSNEYPKLYIEMGEIIHSNLDKIDINILSNNIMDNAEKITYNISKKEKYDNEDLWQDENEDPWQDDNDYIYAEAIDIISGIVSKIDLKEEDKTNLLKTFNMYNLEKYQDAYKCLEELKDKVKNNKNLPQGTVPMNNHKDIDR